MKIIGKVVFIRKKKEQRYKTLLFLMPATAVTVFLVIILTVLW